MAERATSGRGGSLRSSYLGPASGREALEPAESSTLAAGALISLHGASHLDGRAAAVHDRRTPQRAFLRREAPTRPPGFPEPPPPPNPSESAA
jgi:hypothetical protein